MSASYNLLFVCTGNICRSPTAEGILRHKLREHADLGVQVASAGTHGYHLGEPPDPRSIAAAKRRGYDISDLRARQISARDFTDFQLLLALDDTHLRQLQRIQPKNCPATVSLFLEYAGLGSYANVPDPYYGSTAGFEHALDLIEAGADGLIARIRRELAK